MKHILNFLLLTTLLAFTACGGGASDATPTTTDLTQVLKAKSFYTIEDNVKTKNIYKITFDENLTSWNIKSFDNNYATPTGTPLDNNITVTSTSVKNSGGYSYKLQETTAEYLHIVAALNPLVSMKLFTKEIDAQNYYDTSLKNELQSKEFFVVQNNLYKRSLLKIAVAKDASSWDITTYNANFTTPTTSSYGLNITLTDASLTDSGALVFSLNTKNREYIQLVSDANALVTLRFYNSQTKAEEYCNSKDLRNELRSKSFFSVYTNNGTKKLYKFFIDENLSTWSFSSYASDFNQTALQNGTNTILVTEDRLIETNGDTLIFQNNSNDFIELQSATNETSSFRLYKTAKEAESYSNSQ